jgi:hypothetical protein
LRKTDKYKFLGNYVNDKGNIDDQLKFMESKVSGAIREANKICCQNKVGKGVFEAKKLVYRLQVTKAVFHNIEAWTNLRKADWEKLECIQGKILRGLFGLPKSTPYWGMLYELDIIPVKLLHTYQRMMVYHNMMNSDSERIARDVLIEQEKNSHRECWIGNAKEEASAIGLEVSKEIVEGKSKSSWKKEVKDKITAAFEKEAETKKQQGKKLRFLRNKVERKLTSRTSTTGRQ